MEDKQRARSNRKVHPKERANFITDFFFCWELPIFIKGWRKEISEDDLYEPLAEFESKRLTNRLERFWTEEERFKKKPSLLRALLKAFGSELCVSGILYFPVDLAIVLFQPYCLRLLLNYYTPGQNETSLQQAYFYSIAILLLSLLRVLTFHRLVFKMAVLGMKVRVACSSLIYRKSLKLKKATLQSVTTGQVINLLSNDVNRLDFAFMYIHFIWISPVEIVVGALYIDYTLGHPALIGIGLILANFVFQMYISKRLSTCRFAGTLRTDYRIRLMNDIIIGIQAIKMYTWEKTFIKLVQAARKLELKEQTKTSNCRILNNCLRLFYTRASTYFCVLALVLTGQFPTSQYVFALLNVYEFLKITCIILSPHGVTLFSEAYISFRRIEEFLLTDFDKPNKLISARDKSKTEPGCILTAQNDLQRRVFGVCLKNVTVRWDSMAYNVLNEASLVVDIGEVVGITGAAGSGKSTLLQVVLKEIDVRKGRVDVGGAVSYASQDAWIFSASIKQNILFGEEMDAEKYRRVIRVCALERDFTLFPFGDNTLVGDRGVMLSGGQKARINLARAVYRNADIYLLDDPLSAVDAHVAGQILEECILGYLRNKCVILVTHQVHFLRHAKTVYLLEMGQLTKLEQDLQFDKSDSPGDNLEELKLYDVPQETKEHRSVGTTRNVYQSYCRASGAWVKTVAIVLLLVVAQVLANVTEFFLAFWINLEQESTFGLRFRDRLTRSTCLYIYTGLTLVFLLVNAISLKVLVRYCVDASKTLHDTMLKKVVYGDMTFFNHHSAGRILNRFAKDIGCIDEYIPLNLLVTVTMILLLIGIILTVCILNYWMVIPTVVILFVMVFFGVIFQPTNKNIKRTEAITKSSVLTHITATLQGLTTIRAFSGEKILEEEFDNLQNYHSSSFYMLNAIYCTLTFWMDLSCFFYNCLVIFSFFIFGSQMYVGYVGLAITQSTALVGLIQHGMKTWSELDAQMTSVERVLEYSELTPEEDHGELVPPESWPDRGQISFQSVSMSYSSHSPVLKQVTVEIRGGEKVGVVGRTGAGKTSLISAIFRLFRFEGTILVDNVDTKSVPLAVLRSKISIIPQDPVLFLGSLRKNLDPFDSFTDGELWNALEEVQMKDVVSDWPGGLETLILEGGANVSVGQRQLVCLARAILRRAKVIVLDEATANVDLKTDQLIQGVIRDKFKECTMLTIAHRLNTVMDSDKILVMDAGRVAEFGSPEELLENPEGHFFRYVSLNSKAKNK